MKRWQILLWVLVLGLLIGPLGVGCSSEKDSEKKDEKEQAAQSKGLDDTKRITGAFSPATPVKGAVGDLAKRLPNNTLGFLTTSGGAVLSDQFKQSHLGKLWNDPGVQKFRQDIETELMRMLTDQNAEGKMWFDLVKDNILLALNQPLLIGVAEKSAGQPDAGPPIYGFAMLDAGANKTKIEAALQKLEGMIGPENIVDVKVGNYTFHGPNENEDVPGYWGWVDNLLVFAINDGEGLTLQNLTSAAGANQPAVKALEKVHAGNDILAMHINIEKALKLIQRFIQSEGGEEAPKVMGVMETVLVDLGLKDVKSITSRMGFTGTDMVSEAWVEVPQPFTGLLKSLKPLNMSVFDNVDGRAYSASACNISLPEIYDTVMQLIQKVAPSPEDYQEVQAGIAQFEQQMGFKIRDEFLGSLSGPIVSYALPAGAMMEAPSGAFAIMLQLNDEAKMTKAMTAIENFAKAMMEQQAEGMLQITQQSQGDTAMHVWTIAPLALLQIQPTWLIAKNQMVIASSPALVKDTLKQLSGTGGASIRSQAGFQQVTKQLPANLLGFGYVDSKLQLTYFKMMADRFWPMAAMFAQQAKIKLPAMLPDISAVVNQMGPGSDMLWSESDGLYMRSQGPIPTGGMALVAVTAGMGALVPALGTARSEARSTVSLSNIRQISMGCIMYAEDQGKMPANLQDIKSYIGDERTLESPQKPKDFPGPSYIYVDALAGKKMDELKFPEEIVIIYENPAFSSDEINVGFLDGHCEKMTQFAFRKVLEETYKQLGQPMPNM
jgi:hypothetical protein